MLVAARQSALSWVLRSSSDADFIVLHWMPEISVSMHKYYIEELAWDAGAVHARHMAHPAKQGLCSHGIWADKARSVQDVEVSHYVLPPDVHK